MMPFFQTARTRNGVAYPGQAATGPDKETHVTTVVPFTQMRMPSRRPDRGDAPAGAGGEIVIFPGVRIERYGENLDVGGHDAAGTGELYGPVFGSPVR